MLLQRVFLGVLVVSVAVFTALLAWTSRNRPDMSTGITITRYLVNTISCRIPDFNPFDRSIADLYTKHGAITCTGRSSMTYQDGTILRLNRTAIKSYVANVSDVFCQLQEIVRGASNPEHVVTHTGDIITFRADVRVNAEFIKVHCFSGSNNKSIYTNVHSFIVPRDSVETRSDRNFKLHKQLRNPKEVLNVLLIGVDSVSRLNFIRHMPLTRNYLLQELDATELQGYTKLADNTFPCVVPLLTGKFVEQLPWNERLKGIPFDKYNFIWNNFSDSGYRTLYAEDSPNGQIFHYHKSGFQTAPADHYYRAFGVALEEASSMWNSCHHCFGDRTEGSILLKYVRDFASTYRDKPHFGFAFLTRLTHDQINLAGAADDMYVKFLQEMHSEGLLNNTVMLFYSDHGIRFGKIRETYIGKVEERLPMSLIVFPKWFNNKYPNLMKNVNINSKRLITLFDVHETMNDILHFTGTIPTYGAEQRGRSLFSEVPSNRTCAEAGILEHWCTCFQRERVLADTPEVIMSSQVIISHINEKISQHHDTCAVLHVHRIIEALKMVTNDKILKFRAAHNDDVDSKIDYGKRVNAVVSYTVTVEVKPGGGLFEGTVLLQEGEKQYSLSGDLSRINKYGNQSDCINFSTLKKFCVCI